ncbi:MAG: iron-sulfur cluster assembly scaffold protein [Alphaproteobacteria bacterium]|nr:iron-sulfur cluster assembly scaffold protein [Alphaproteobacteria bacterium]
MTADADLAALYQDRVRHWAARVRNDRRLSHPAITVTKSSPLCGSALTFDVRADGRTLVELGYRVRACTLGMAAAAVVVANGPGTPVADILFAGQMLRRLLAGEDVHFQLRGTREMFVAARAFKAAMDRYCFHSKRSRMPSTKPAFLNNPQSFARSPTTAVWWRTGGLRIDVARIAMGDRQQACAAALGCLSVVSTRSARTLPPWTVGPPAMSARQKAGVIFGLIQRIAS